MIEHKNSIMSDKYWSISFFFFHKIYNYSLIPPNRDISRTLHGIVCYLLISQRKNRRFIEITDITNIILGRTIKIVYRHFPLSIVSGTTGAIVRLRSLKMLNIEI